MTSEFPNISCRPYTSLSRHAALTLSSVTTPSPGEVDDTQHVTIQPDPEEYPDEASSPLRTLGDNLTPSMTYKLHRGTEVSIELNGPGTFLFVPTTPSGGIGSTWQFTDPFNRNSKPYVPSAEEADKMSEIIETERMNPHPPWTHSRIHDVTVALNPYHRSDTRAIVRPGHTLLVPVGPSLSQMGGAFSNTRKSHFLLLEGDVDLTAGKPQQVFRGKITSFGEGLFGNDEYRQQMVNESLRAREAKTSSSHGAAKDSSGDTRGEPTVHSEIVSTRSIKDCVSDLWNRTVHRRERQF